ncbi:peptidoglycan D,D-transpeptidase FtsI family protein [Clostridium taeniosporum]|uniref:Penicillin-binding protein 2 n=1 Tax=Clostridium taeniosporum TaxID=394958 RepID=A0A1D7XNJ8_9CLOT|nr:penicillin-binding transpeptidase domain-containing protein [Clostridium taeniosporum]AOR24911.1 penicillin-binding protein 2 [Clostridium taeniosporum]
MAFFITLIIVLTMRLYVLQVHPSEKVQVSYQNHQMENISDIKYMILDTNGKDLMKYDKKYILVIDIKPFSLNNYEETLEDLMALNFIMKSEKPEFNYSEIMKSQGKIYYNISEETYNKINKLKNIKGIYTYVSDKVDTKKAWSVSSFLSDILDENQIEGSLQYELKEYLKNNDLPKKNFYLNDKSVYAKQSVNINKDNKNLKLTIDKDIEDKIRSVLEKDEYKYLKNVGVSILESDTGKIRALVQKDESAANINLGIQEIGYEPGSIYKIITLASALEMGLVNVNDIFTCNSNICRVNHGTLTVRNALVKSCNDIFGKIGSLVGYDKLMEYSKKQGLYSRVLNLEGENKNETSGIQPKEEAGMNNISIGQCMNVSPIQMLGAVNTIVNNGVYVKPYLVESILDKDDNAVKEFKSDRKKIYSEITSRLVKDAMKEVVLKGTGIKAYIPNFNIGGKTGSATSSDGNTHGWFVGYFNFNNKTYTMLVFVPNIESQNLGTDVELGGGDTAAPIFRDIVKTLNNK